MAGPNARRLVRPRRPGMSLTTLLDLALGHIPWDSVQHDGVAEIVHERNGEVLTRREAAGALQIVAMACSMFAEVASAEDRDRIVAKLQLFIDMQPKAV